MTVPEGLLAELLGLNEEQLRAAADCGHEVLVSAGAGTGKTRVLTARYLFLVAVHGYRPAQIAAITFTNKAALEMRERIRRTLASLAERFPSAAETAAELGLAPIQTIHSFCLRLMREEPMAAGLAPGFAVLEEGEARLLLREACEEALADGLARLPEPPGLRELLRSFGRRRLLGLMLETHEAFRTHGLDPAAAQGEEGIAESPAVAGGALLQWWEELGAVEEAGLPEGTRKALAELRNLGGDLAAAIARADADDPVLGEVENLLGGLRAGSCRSLAEEGRERLARFFTALAAAKAARIRPAFLELLRAAGASYEAAKRRRGAVDFADLELSARRLLAGEEVRRRLRSRYPILLIDEFQDTNPLQWAIIEAFWRGPGGSRLFVVGDLKQSIYRFRGAEVRIMASLRRELENGGGRVYALQENYRCLPPLAAFVNHVSGRLLGEYMVYEPLLPKRAEADQRPRVEALLVPGANLDREAEASLVAERITGILSGRERLVLGEDGPRPPEPGEIALLFRAATDMGLYERALRAAGIPYRVLAGGGFFHRQEVADLLGLLAAVEDAGDGTALAAALRSPLFGLSDAGLYLLAREAGLVAGFLAADPPPEGLGEDGPRLEKARAVIGRLRERRHLLGLDGLLEEAMAATDYRAVQSAFPDYRQRLANLENLLELARGYARLGRGEIGDFLSYLEAMERLEIREGEVSAAGGREAVTLLTVHRAKGLEFPVVFLPDLGRTVNGRRPEVLVDEEGRIGFRFGAKAEGKATPIWREIDERIGIEEEAEAKRLLYVAMTRARDYLVLVGSGRRGGKNWLAWLAETVPLPEEGERVLYPGGELVLRRSPAAAPPILAPRTPAARYPGIKRGESLGLPVGTKAVPAPLPFHRSKPPALTVSAVLDLRACPRRFYLRYVLGLPEWRSMEAGGGEGGGPVLGSLVHALAAELAASGEGAAARAASGRQGLVEDEAVERLLANYARAESMAALSRARRVWTEYEFALALPSGVLSGAADLVWLDEEGRPCLADLKTNRLDRPGGWLLAEHSLQVQLYALALRRLFGGPVARAKIEYLWPGVGVEVPCDSERLDGLEVELDGLLRFLAGSPGFADFPARPGEACRWCGYRGVTCAPGEAG